MTLEELCPLSADKLEAITDKELEEICKPYLPQTRPEYQAKREKKSSPIENVEKNLQFQEAKKIAAKFGINLSDYGLK